MPAALLSAAAGAAAAGSLADALARAVLPVLRNRSAASNNTAWGVSYRDADLSLSWCAGEADLATGAACSPGDAYAWGSMTKPSTALLVLQYVADGALSLDEPFAPRADPYLRRYWNATVAGLYGARAAAATVRQVLGMQIGLADYNDEILREYVNANPAVDVPPDWYLRGPAQNRTPMCPPGECVVYSSDSYVLLGALAAGLAGARTWEEFDQTQWMRNGTRGRFAATRYALRGPCHDFVTAAGTRGGTVHGYQPHRGPSGRRDGPGADVYNISCLFGWTMGNLVAPTRDVAELFWALLGPEGDDGLLLPRPLRDAMLPSRGGHFCESFSGGHGHHRHSCDPTQPPFSVSYGLGLMNFTAMRWGFEQRGPFYGHNGVTYGFASQAGYHPGLRFSLAFSHNEEAWIGHDEAGGGVNPIYGAVTDTVARFRGGG